MKSLCTSVIAYRDVTMLIHHAVFIVGFSDISGTLSPWSREVFLGSVSNMAMMIDDLKFGVCHVVMSLLIYLWFSRSDHQDRNMSVNGIGLPTSVSFLGLSEEEPHQSPSQPQHRNPILGKREVLVCWTQARFNFFTLTSSNGRNYRFNPLFDHLVPLLGILQSS